MDPLLVAALAVFALGAVCVVAALVQLARDLRDEDWW